MVRIWCEQDEIVDPSCLLPTPQAKGGGGGGGEVFYWHTLGPSACLKSVAGHIRLMATSSRILNHVPEPQTGLEQDGGFTLTGLTH